MSKDFGKILLAKTDDIIKSWVETIREDSDIESSESLAYVAVQNSIPLVVEALATLLSETITDQPTKLENSGLEHGIVRAGQGYDVAEIVREYSLLRKIIFSTLKPDLLVSSGEDILRNVDLIDSSIDRVVSLSLDSYVEARIQELKRVRGHLVLSNQELTRLVSAQREDLAHLAHELKSPLNSIMGFSSLLLQQQQKPGQKDDRSLSLQMTEKVIKNSKQLLRLINDVLEMSRYESGKIELNIESINVRSLLKEIVEAFEPSAAEKNIDLILDGDRAPELVQTDAIKLRQIITNLISNAIRYTETGTITVTCSLYAHAQWSMQVKDTGTGISREAQAQIFEPYYRAGAKSNYAPESTGLGLAIVDKLSKLLQGNVVMASEPNQGSTFTATFPLAIDT